MIKTISNPKLKDPLFIAAWPGMGEVAYKTALFLREALDFKIFAKLEAGNFFKPAGVIVEKGVLDFPQISAGHFYYYKSGEKNGSDIILFLGEAQPSLEHGQELARAVIDFAKKYKVKLVTTFAAKPEPVDHKKPSKVSIASTNTRVRKQFLDRFNLDLIKRGQISGLNGLILGVAKKAGLKGVCFLAEIPVYTIQIENPKANISILKILDDYLRLNLNLDPLIERAKFIESEIDKLMGYLKGETQNPPPLGEEDIQKIKKDLSTYTKLPQSVREEIEKLFKQARKDISKASVLKDLLDRWHVYSEYEDRFLNLFKRDKRNGSH
jgi:hypothetical protein